MRALPVADEASRKRFKKGSNANESEQCDHFFNRFKPYLGSQQKSPFILMILSTGKYWPHTLDALHLLSL